MLDATHTLVVTLDQTRQERYALRCALAESQRALATRDRALEQIQGAYLLAAAVDDELVRIIMLDEIRRLVEGVLGPAWSAANEREDKP